MFRCPELGEQLLTPSSQTHIGEPGGRVTHTVRLKSWTGRADSFLLSLQPGSTWTTTLALTRTAVLSDQASIPIDIWVDIPNSAASNDFDRVTIEPRSVTSPTVYSDTARLTTVAYIEPFRVLLPILFNRICRDFFDDSSDSQSGWSVGESAFVRAEYVWGSTAS